MDNLKRCWINELTPDLFSITFESEHILPDFKDLLVIEMRFPETPNTIPKRHTINLGHFTLGDLLEMKEMISEFIEGQLPIKRVIE